MDNTDKPKRNDDTRHKDEDEMEDPAVKLSETLTGHTTIIQKQREDHGEFRKWAFRAIADIDFHLSVVEKEAGENQKAGRGEVRGRSNMDTKKPK